jgi:hypothetical protein
VARVNAKLMAAADPRRAASELIDCGHRLLLTHRARQVAAGGGRVSSQTTRLMPVNRAADDERVHISRVPS